MLDMLSVTTYISGFIMTLYRPGSPVSTLLVGGGLAANLTVVSGRYVEAWPMMPMHLGAAAISSFLAIIWVCSYGGIRGNQRHNRQFESLILLAIISSIALITLLFPKDFYLPFLRSNIIWSHIFLLTGIVAKGCLIHSGVKALVFLHSKNTDASKKRQEYFASTTNWIVNGYALLTISLFSGELWSYLGWGTPVVWHDAALTTILALWLYWTCFLHLLFISSWSQKQRSRFVVAGAALVLFLACHPDMGPFRLPFPVQG